MRALAGLPQLEVEVGGVALPPAQALSLGAVRVQQRLSLPTLCELSFFAPAGDPVAEGLGPGAELRVMAAGRPEPLFTGEVTAAEYAYGSSGRRDVRVRGYDALHRLRKRQAVRAHVEVTLADLARELCGEVGLTVEAADPGPLWRHFIQHRQSNLELLTELADRCGLYLTLRGAVLHLVTLEGIGEALPLQLGESLLEARIDVSGDPACRAVTARGWDPLVVEHFEGRAAAARVGRAVAAEVPPEQVGGIGERWLAEQVTAGPSHLDALAQAALDRAVAREVVLRGTAEGDPRLVPGARVEVRGVDPSIEGRYVLTEVTHQIDAERGFISELSSAPLPARPRPGGVEVALGLVSRVDDPEGLGRVRVSLPAQGEVETDWMQVVAPGGGKGRGLALLPDVGDRVLVCFPEADPARGLVVGGLYGAEGLPEDVIAGGAVRRCALKTSGGLMLRLDDEARTLRVEDALGSFLELSPERVRLHAKTELVIDAPGQKVSIRGDALDLRRE